MIPRPLLSRLTRSYGITLFLVALFAAGGYGVSQLGASVQRAHLAQINLVGRQQALIAEGMQHAVQLLGAGDGEARLRTRNQLRRVAVDLAVADAQLHNNVDTAGIGHQLIQLLTGSSESVVVDRPLLASYLRQLETLAAGSDATALVSQSGYSALLAAYNPLVAHLIAIGAEYELIMRADVAAIAIIQTITLILVLSSLGAEALFIFRPLFARLTAEHHELALLSLVASKTDNGVIITDALGLTEWVNDSFVRISGYTLADLRGRTPGAVLQGPDTSPATVAAIRAVLRAGQPIRTEIVNYHKDGHPYWLDLSITPVYDAQGRVVRFIAIEIDITARKDLEGSVRSALKDLSDVTFALHQAAIVSVTDPQGHILDANDLFCQLAGYRLDELIGQNHRILRSGHHDAAFWRNLWETISQGRVWRGEICNHANDGRGYWLQTTVVPALNTYGQPARYLAVSFDITERKHAEAALRERTMRLQLRSDIVALTRGVADEAEVIDRVVGEIARHFPGMRVAYSTIDSPGTMRAICTRQPDALPSLADLSVDLTVAPAYLAALRSGQTLAIADIARDQRLAPLSAVLQAGRTRALLDVPVVHSAGLIGLLCADSPQPHSWSEHELAMMGEAAEYLAMALHDAHIQMARVQAEVALRASEAHLRFQKTLLECQSEASPDGLLVVSPDRRWLSFNQRFLTIWGLPAMALTSATHDLAMPLIRQQLIDYEGFLDRLDELYRQPDAFGHDEICLRDGRTLERYTAPIRSADGEYFGRFWSYRDITARVMAESALRDSEATNRALLDAIPDLMFRLRTDGTFLGYRAARISDLAVPPEAFLGRSISEVFMPDLSTQLMAAIRMTEATGGLQRFEYELAVNGVMRDFEARITLIGGGEVLVIVRDISERKAHDRLKNEFISMVSHELRTPLTSIRGSLGLIAGGVAGELPAQARTMIDIAHKNSERLVRLINDILDIEKIESGKMTFNRQPIALAPLIQQTMESLGAFGAQYGVSFQLEPPPDVQIYADPDLIIQVLTNLLSNAAKFSPAGEMVTTRVERRADGVRISVIDCGPGIPESFRNRIFQKFAQADSSSTRAKGGTGLGLSIARAIVERHEGQISFESAPGHGTIFHVDLPEWRPAPPQAASAAAARILICEDDLDIAQLLTIMLRKAGFVVDVATSAAEARRRLADRPYAGMTLDIRMSNEDGLGLIRELRASESTRDLPIVVVSAQAERARTELSGDLLGVIAWLSKPIDRKRLIAAITGVVRGAPSATPHILHVENDLDVVRVVASVLGSVATMSHAASVAAARARLAEGHIDLVLLDLDLPDGSGSELLPLLQAQSPPIPAVVFSVNEIEAGAGKVAAALVKSRAANQELHKTITDLLVSLLSDNHGHTDRSGEE